MTTSSSPPIRLLATSEQVFPANAPQILLQAPGREMWAAASLNGTPYCTLYSADGGTRTRLNSQSAKRYQTIYHRPLPRWVRYLAGVMALIDVADMPGIDAVLCGDEPRGPRYDYALAMLFAALWYTINRQAYTPEALQEIAERVRREYIGERS